MSCLPWRPFEGEPLPSNQIPEAASDDDEGECPECGSPLEEDDEGRFCPDCGFEP